MTLTTKSRRSLSDPDKSPGRHSPSEMFSSSLATHSWRRGTRPASPSPPSAGEARPSCPATARPSAPPPRRPPCCPRSAAGIPKKLACVSTPGSHWATSLKGPQWYFLIAFLFLFCYLCYSICFINIICPRDLFNFRSSIGSCCISRNSCASFITFFMISF